MKKEKLIKERLRIKRMTANEVVGLPECLKKRAVVFNNHHYIRIKWVQSYIDFIKKEIQKNIKI